MVEARLLLVEDDDDLREALVDTLLLAQYRCISVSCAEEAIIFLQQNSSSIDLVISDVQMQGIGGIGLLKYMQQYHGHIPLLLMTAFATIDSAIAAIKQGAMDYLPKPFSSKVLLEQVSRYLMPAANASTNMSNNMSKKAQPFIHRARSTVTASREMARDLPIAADPQSLALLDLAKRVAKSEASVMISGPSGTGKEVLAKYIHHSSPRAKQPFIAINCAAIPDNMLEATLFGYEKGAFTGAYQACSGKFEQAQGGSLLLDEISEMPLALQAKLLRVLQEWELERIGGRKTIKLDVRVLATSNRDLKQMVKEGAFREDLYYRINVFPLTWPALKERPKDIIPLAQHCLHRHCDSEDVAVLSEAAKRRLWAYSWPGNVRELDNVLQRALILSTTGEILPQDLMLDDDWQPDKHMYPVDAHSASPTRQEEANAHFQAEACFHHLINPHTNKAGAPREYSDKLPKFNEINELNEENVPNFTQKWPLAQLSAEKQTQEHTLILATLQHYQGQRKSVAEKLGISPRTLRYKMAKMRDLGFEIPSG
ncbi:sigma-54-dependent transcriptional regulator [Shewanella surugensis]|uniref:Sigma-54 dependent transcriptional regulator n=1 Tax=Shewanella surugensis TaxID=212020 RepID=A0ABT0LCN0_9GAMM|nr:sigma-54 dependent transcriptional regulator [Shewanella surugensis]MCL1125463.1 sigma-54 dependent transcriptional regulator [Shewanella surugensis]